MTRFYAPAILFLALMISGVPARGQDAISPDISTAYQAVDKTRGAKFMVATSHPQATKAGYDILARGGTAADAAVAVQAVLGLVEPQSSGIGGGGFALYYDAATGSLTTFDGREMSPSTAGKHLFRGKDGDPMAFYDAAVGGRAVGVPGIIAMLEKLHAGGRGKLPWRDLFSPALALAEQGFEVSPRLARDVRADVPRLKHSTDTQLYFLPDSSTPIPPGHMLRNPAYAGTLREIALNGARAFYNGKLAEDMVRTVREDSKNPGLLSIEDLQTYTAKERPAVCGPYRGYKVCSMGEPSSGGLTLLSILGMLQPFNLPSMGPDDPKAWHIIGEASRLAFADRNYYMADPDKVKTPGATLIDPAYLLSRAKMISADAPIENAMPGTPPGWNGPPAAPDTSTPPPGTSHISIIDSFGNIVSLTTSIENVFGSRLMVGGFLLNNQLTDFSFVPDVNGQKVANAVEGRKRPRSSMTPVIVFAPDGKPFLVIGSAGGSAIIGYVLERIIAVIDWGMDIGTAVNISNVIHRGTGFEMEDTAQTLAEGIEAMGHPVEIKPLNSGITAIQVVDDIYVGAVDPRREGEAKGM